MKKKSESIIVKQPAFSEWLIKKRQSLNLSKADLIRLAYNKISERTIKNLESGRHTNFRENTIIELADCLALTYEDLLLEIKNLSSENKQEKQKSNKYWFFILLFMIILIFTSVLIINNSSKEPFQFIGTQDGFKIVDKNDTPLFTKEIIIVPEAHKIIDIDNDKHNEVIVGVHFQKITGTDPKRGSIIAYNYQGNLLWNFHPFKNHFYKEGGLSSNYQITSFIVDNFYMLDSKEIIATFREVGFSPSCIVTLNQNGEEISRYWNPGVILKILYNKAYNLILVHLVNNRFKEDNFTNVYPNCIALFDANKIKGQAPPYNGNGSKTGSHLWYIQIKPTGSKIDYIDFVDHLADGTTDIKIRIDNETIYMLDLEGNITESIPTDIYSGIEHNFIRNK